MPESGYSNFKQSLFGAIRQEVGEERLAAFSQRLDFPGNGYESAFAETDPAFGNEELTELLRLVFDLDMTMDKLRQALAHLKSPPSGAPDVVGAWGTYHYEQWLFLMFGFLERLEKLGTRFYRVLVRPKDAKEWNVKQDAFKRDVQKLSEEVGKVRHPVAHGGGGGVDGIPAVRLWEPVLLGGGFRVREAYEEIDRATVLRWHGQLFVLTLQAFIALEALAGRLRADLP